MFLAQHVRANQPITDIERTEIWDLRQSGASYNRIGKEVYRSQTTIKRVLHHMEIAAKLGESETVLGPYNAFQEATEDNGDSGDMVATLLDIQSKLDGYAKQALSTQAKLHVSTTLVDATMLTIKQLDVTVMTLIDQISDSRRIDAQDVTIQSLRQQLASSNNAVAKLEEAWRKEREARQEAFQLQAHQK